MSVISRQRATYRKRLPDLVNIRIDYDCSLSDYASNLFIDDPTISNRHLKVYSVIFDQNDQTNTEPLVYAEDLSSNGSYWNGSLIGKGNGGVLLSDGDEVRISPRVTLIFEAIANRAKEVLDSVQELEKRASGGFQSLKP